YLNLDLFKNKLVVVTYEELLRRPEHTAKAICNFLEISYEENMIIEFDKMKKLCWETIEQLDHRNLNELFDFPTSENITEWIFENLKDKIPLHSVKFFEGTNKYCEITSD
ncbi:MAG: 6-carboxytetrahydropterin synthase, partial [Candidatus Nitrosopelagicus sp.]|nr:6-carboxytetrahydropterin synthase [Candidatus Nitrosopelagicus sp.]